jgi:hypothetical protein
MPTRTLSQVVAEARRILDRGTAYDAAIRASIQNTIHLLRAERLGFNEERRALMIGAELVTLPGEVLEIDSIRIDSGNAFEVLFERTPNWLLAERKSQTYQSEPIYFAFERNGQDKQLRFYPVPDETYSAQLQCLVDVAFSLSSSWSDGTVLPWFDDAYLVTLYGSLAEVNATHVGGPEGLAEAEKYSRMYDSALRRLRGQVRLQQHSGTIQPCM